MRSNELEDHKHARALIGLYKDWGVTFMAPAALESCKVADCASGGGRIGAFSNEFIDGGCVGLVLGFKNVEERGEGGEGRKGEKEERRKGEDRQKLISEKPRWLVYS